MLFVDPNMIPFRLKSYTKNGMVHLETAVSVQDMDRVPRIEAEPVRYGRMVLVHDGMMMCTACGQLFAAENIERAMNCKYCSECGAKMRG